jgi:hypothetical protein
MKISRIWMRTGLRRAVWLVLLALPAAPASARAEMVRIDRYEGGSTPAAVDSTDARFSPMSPAARRAAPKPRRLYAGVVFGGGAWTSEDNDGLGTVGLSLGGYPRPRVRVDGIVTFSDIAFLPDSALGKAFRNAEAAEVGLNLTARYDPTDNEATVRIYPLVGVGAGTMFWNYTKPITVVDDVASRAVGYDGIFYFSFYGGAGGALVLTPHLTVGGSLVGGTRLYDQSMGSGVKNDLLKQTGFVRILFELNYLRH